MNTKFFRSFAAAVMAGVLVTAAAPQTGIQKVDVYAAEQQQDENILSEVQLIHGVSKVDSVDNDGRRLDVKVLTSTKAGYVPAGNYKIQWLVNGEVVKEGSKSYWTKEEDAGKTITAKVVFKNSYAIYNAAGEKITEAVSNPVKVTQKVTEVKSYHISNGLELDRYDRVAVDDNLKVVLKDQDKKVIDPSAYSVTWAEQKKNYGDWTDIASANEYTVTKDNAGSILRATAEYNGKKYIMLVEVNPYLEGVHVTHGVTNVAGKTVTVGSRLQADPYKTNGDAVAMANFSVEWKDKDGNQLSTNRTYRPTAADAGKTLTVTVTFKNGYAICNQDGQKIETASATVKVADKISISSVELSENSFTCNGEVQQPEVVKVLDENGVVVDKDNYTVEFEDSKEPGTYKVTVTGQNTYKGALTVTYEIKAVEKPNKPSSSGTTAQTDNGRSVMFRLYNPNSGEHFFTSDADEKNNLVKLGWKAEGSGWTAPARSSSPVYRLYNPNAGEHHYTLDEKERDSLTEAGWKYEGIAWYSDDAKGVPVYRLYNPNAFANNHTFTTSTEERDSLIAKGWKDEGIAWYGRK